MQPVPFRRHGFYKISWYTGREMTAELLPCAAVVREPRGAKAASPVMPTSRLLETGPHKGCIGCGSRRLLNGLRRRAEAGSRTGRQPVPWGHLPESGLAMLQKRSLITSQ